jgi:hypothetical protein
VEIRIVLDIVEPPAGGVGVVGDPVQSHHLGSQLEISLSGWPELLSALYELTAEPGRGAAAPGIQELGLTRQP